MLIRLRKALHVLRLTARNRWSRSPVTGDVDAIVSMTTYGPRFRSVHFALESIALGARRPRRLVLWLDEPDLIANPTPALSRLIARGLEVLPAEDHGPHKKYLPALEPMLNEGIQRLITADDDMIYSRGWLARLDQAAAESPGSVVCHRARVVQFDGDAFAPWSEWPLCESTNPSVLNFAIGDTGVSYPRSVAAELKRRGTGFVEVAPRADDIWLHAAAVAVGATVRQVSPQPAQPLGIPGSQEVTLSSENVADGGNDRQLAATYRRDELDVLRSARDEEAR